jgi:hypothetical protein
LSSIASFARGPSLERIWQSCSTSRLNIQCSQWENAIVFRSHGRSIKVYMYHGLIQVYHGLIQNHTFKEAKRADQEATTQSSATSS